MILPGIAAAIGLVQSLASLISKAVAESRDLTPEEIDAVTQARHVAEDALEAEVRRRNKGAQAFGESGY